MDKEKSRKEMKEKEPEKRNRKSDEERFSEYSEKLEREYREKLLEHRKKMEERRKLRQKKLKLHCFLFLFFLAAVIAAAVFAFPRLRSHLTFPAAGSKAAKTTAAPQTEKSSAVPEESSTENNKAEILGKAELLAKQYDYDGAEELLKNSAYAEDAEFSAKLSELEAAKSALVQADNTKIPHVFFHSLIVDTTRALTEDKMGKAYNAAMTTIPEFEAILKEMYERGFVMVHLHDIASLETQEDGTKKMVQKKIMLPEGKKPFVMSEDDVNYYEYMTGHGFADKMVLDDAGKPTLQYTDSEGKVTTGDYDIVPILDKFVAEHPDFAYHGHKAIIALTGYNGTLGYRTDETYDANSGKLDPKNRANPSIEEDRETVKKITAALKEDGYEFASHSWGHINFTNRSLEDLTTDTEKWKRNVEPLLPDPCDILIYPFGADIKGWHVYNHAEDAKFNMLEEHGFHYFCNVDSSQYWVQYGDDFMRQGRRNLDGYRLYEAFSGQADHVSDLMDVKKVFDQRRPTPINWQ